MKKLLSLAVLFALVFSLLSCNRPAQKTADNNKGNDNRPVATELQGTGPDGKVYKLSDYRGKIVLLDFWASWCGPCRRFNPSVVAVYNKYKDKKFKNAKAFDVFSVSLDRSAGAWKNAISQDQLTWPGHICDFKMWESDYAAAYNIVSIPHNFLIDQDGHIIGQELGMDELDKMLAGMMK